MRYCVSDGASRATPIQTHPLALLNVCELLPRQTETDSFEEIKEEEQGGGEEEILFRGKRRERGGPRARKRRKRRKRKRRRRKIY
jgi:hypothetical protein